MFRCFDKLNMLFLVNVFLYELCSRCLVDNYEEVIVLKSKFICLLFIIDEFVLFDSNLLRLYVNFLVYI